MYHMEFCIVLNDDWNKGDLTLFDDCGNDIHYMYNVFDCVEEIISFEENMPHTLLEYNNEYVEIEDFKKKHGWI